MARSPQTLGCRIALAARAGLVAGAVACAPSRQAAPATEPAVVTPPVPATVADPSMNETTPPPPRVESVPLCESDDCRDGADDDCCRGLNECKGQGACKTDDHDCAGLNECKGLGGCRAHCPK